MKAGIYTESKENTDVRETLALDFNFGRLGGFIRRGSLRILGIIRKLKA